MVSAGAGRVSGPHSPVNRIAARWKATPSQLALAWLLARSPVILPIPGSSKVEHLEENVAAAELKIDENKCRNWTVWRVPARNRRRRPKEITMRIGMICSRIHRLHLLGMAFIQSRVHLGYRRRPAEARS